MRGQIVRVLIVDDYEPWRRYVRLALLAYNKLQVIGEASDGLEAVEKARQLQPDLILLDVGLPKLNGIEAARGIREVSPTSKILFVSGNRAWDLAEEGLRVGACGYVVKSDAGRELLPAVEAVLEGKVFLRIGVADHDSSAPKSDHAVAITHSHEVAFYADDNSLVDDYARFIESSLKGGNVVIVVVTESHRASLYPKLEADGVDVAAAMERMRYIPLDAAETLSRLAVDNSPDPVRCAKVIGDLIREAAKGLEAANSRVVVCGEIAPTLLSQGNAEGAIKLERVWDEITKGYAVQTLCGYLSNAFPQHEADPVFQSICAQHSAVHGRGLGH